jgi:DNA repair protein RadC
MKAIAERDRPREKLARVGPGALGDNELVAIVIGQGQPRASALDLANAVLAVAGSVAGLARTAHDELTQVPGIGAARAAQVLAAVELGRRTIAQGASERVQLKSPRAIAQHLYPRHGNQRVEQFGVLLLDTKHRALRTSVISIGTLDASIVHPREVFREAVAAGAAAIVLFHNHPSGDPAPSPEDIGLTERLVAAGVLMGIEVVDHIILGDGQCYSFWQQGAFQA